MTVDEQVRELLEKTGEPLEMAFHEYASAKENLTRLKNKKKTVLKKCEELFEGSVAKKKEQAETSESYQNYLEELAVATGEEQRIKGKIEYLKLRIDALRTSISLEKSLQ